MGVVSRPGGNGGRGSRHERVRASAPGPGQPRRRRCAHHSRPSTSSPAPRNSCRVGGASMKSRSPGPRPFSQKTHASHHPPHSPMRTWRARVGAEARGHPGAGARARTPRGPLPRPHSSWRPGATSGRVGAPPQPASTRPHSWPIGVADSAACAAGRRGQLRDGRYAERDLQHRSGGRRGELAVVRPAIRQVWTKTRSARRSPRWTHCAEAAIRPVAGLRFMSWKSGHAAPLPPRGGRT